jgi:hypothetical protein
VITLGLASWSVAPAGTAARWCLRSSALSVWVTMGFALAYAGALTVGSPHLPYAVIAAVHGTLNAGAFVLAGIVGWALVERTPSPADLPDPPGTGRPTASAEPGATVPVVTGARP